MDIVESLYRDASDLDAFLTLQGEVSLRVYANSNLRKSILLASASFFEKRICEIIIQFVERCAEDEKIVSFISNKAISRQYHTFFDWNANNCNAFLALFGQPFKKRFSERISQSQKIDDSVKSFIEIGRERNRMVHQDFGQYSLEKTLDEIHTLHINAKMFVDELQAALYEKSTN